MLEIGEKAMIQIMYKQGYAKKQIARELGLSINTVRKHIASGTTEAGYKKRPAKPQKLDAYRDYIRERLESGRPHWIPATVILKEIKAQGYEGEISMLRQYMRGQKPAAENVILRYETEAGKQMQVDWAEFGRSSGKLSAFIATLGYSRMSYVEYVENEQLETLLLCHEHAFDYFGGVPQEVLYDNMKTVIVQRDYYGEGEHRLQSGFWDFSKHYNFLPKVCRPYRAQTKGKVERFIHYLKHSFHYPFVAQLKHSGIKLDVSTANYKVLQWLSETANCRVHATTKEIPIERFRKEKSYLQALPRKYVGHVAKMDLEEPKAIEVNSYAIDEILIQHDLSVYEQLLVGGR